MPNSLNITRFFIFIALSISWLQFADAGQNYQWPYVVVDCNTDSHNLVISEANAIDESDIPKGANVRGLDGMYRQEPLGADDAQLVIRDTFRTPCRLRGVDYLVIITPYKHNLQIQGACGAAAPSVKLEVFKNGKVFLKPLIFKINCFLDDGLDQSISRLNISTTSRSVLFDLRNGENKSTKIVHFQALPEISRSKLFNL